MMCQFGYWRRRDVKNIYVYQHDEKDCGAACLATVAAYYKLYYPLQKFRDVTKTSVTGTSLYGLVEGGQAFGFDSEALKGTEKELLEGINRREIVFPFIARTVKGHYIVVFGMTDRGFEVFDPDIGKRVLSEALFFTEWSGYIVTYHVGNEFKPGNCTTSLSLRIYTLVKSQWKRILVVFFLSFILSITGIFLSYIFETLIEELSLVNDINIREMGNGGEIQSENTGGVPMGKGIGAVLSWIYRECGSMHFFFLWLVFISVISAIVSYIRGLVVSNMSKNLDVELTYRYYKHILKLPLESKITRNNGDYLSRFSDAHRIRYAISNATVSLILDTVLAVIGAIILFDISSIMFLAACILIVLYAICALYYKRKLNKSNQEMMIKNADMNSYFKEVLEGMESVKVNVAEEEVLYKGTHYYNEMLKGHYGNDRITIKQGALLNGIETVGNVYLLWLGFSFVSIGKLSLGELITFDMLLAFFTEPIKNLFMLQSTLQSASVAMDRLFDVFDMEIEKKIDGIPFQHGDICMRNVSFRYGNAERVLSNISLSFPKGKLLALVGASGCGKTTLMKLMLRFYCCEEGQIFIGNNQIEQYCVEDLRKNIYYLDQKPFLFADTIRNNLTLGLQGTYSQEEIRYACQLSCIDDFVMSLPGGYETFICENGINLSQGQKQRIAMARSFLRKPSVLILDEALSNVDLDRINTIFSNLRKNLIGTTIIVISHSKEVCEECDRILYM